MRQKSSKKNDNSLKKVPQNDTQQSNFESSPLRFEMEIIFQEFRELRAEILARTANEQQILNYSILLIGATATIIQLEPKINSITGSETGIRVLILAIALLFSALGLMYIEQDMYMATAGKYINKVLSPKLKEIVYKATGVEKRIFEWERFRVESSFRFPNVLAFAFMSSARYALPIFPALISIAYYFLRRYNNNISTGENLLFGFAVFVGVATIIIAVIDGMSFLGIDKEKEIATPPAPPQSHVLKRLFSDGYIIPILTIMIGIFPMALLSFQTSTLWYSPHISFPLFAIPSVFIGDTIFLPWFNFRLYHLFVQARSIVLDRSFLVKTIISAGISYFLNTHIHSLWVGDQYLGFMDMELGKLSVAGVWHLWFSVFQFTLVMLAVWVAIDCYKNKEFQALNLAHDTWQVMVWFSALSILDYLVKHIFIFKDINNIQLLINDFISFSTLTISVLLFFLIKLGVDKLTAQKTSAHSK